MHYHISTGLILQEFPKGSECPVCEIRAIVEKQIVDQFLNEAVMVDNYRDKVNKRGFCAHHYDMLLAGNSKLGVALQAITRMKALAGNVTVPKNAKDAARQADAIDKAGETCLICDLIDFNMQRYYKTIAQMYGNEREFPAMLAGTKGVLLPPLCGTSAQRQRSGRQSERLYPGARRDGGEKSLAHEPGNCSGSATSTTIATARSPWVPPQTRSPAPAPNFTAKKPYNRKEKST